MTQPTFAPDRGRAADGRTEVTVPAVDPVHYGVDCTMPGVCAVTISGPLATGGDPMLSVADPVPVQYAPS